MRARSPARRAFSLGELVFFLAVLALVVAGFLNLFSESTRIAPKRTTGESEPPAGVTAISADLRAAGAGLPPATQAISVPAARGSRPFRSARGQATFPVEGADQLEIRGVLRTPLLPLHGLELRAGGRDGRADLRIPVHRSGFGGGLERVRASLASGAAEHFVVVDANRRGAVARVAAVDSRGVSRGCTDAFSPRRDPCELTLELDFADPEAASMNPVGPSNACAALGRLVSGGLLDSVTYFVARSERGGELEGRYLAVARRAGSGHEVSRVEEGVEDLKVSFGLRGGAPARMEPTRFTSRPPSVELFDALGRSRLRVVKIALVKGAVDPGAGEAARRTEVFEVFPRGISW